jgi:hypothetical protein
MGFEDIVVRHIRARDSGLLSVKLQGEAHLLKVYFDGGEVVALSLGMLKNDDCLARLAGAVILEHFFLPGAKSSAVATVPLTDRLGAAASGARSDQSAGAPPAPPAQAGRPSGPGAGAPDVAPTVIVAVEDECIGVIGPIGTIIVENAMADLGYKRGANMPASSFNAFIEALALELPSAVQAAFRAKYRKG